MAPEELPKGVRKEVSIGSKLVLLFWYRNQIYAISSRSPAEGAYSEGFIKAKFTQDYGIVCPTTGSVFSLKDGSIIEWYPTNPVLRAVTPKSGNLPVRAPAAHVTPTITSWSRPLVGGENQQIEE
jgi:nitrite reductase/ring-hydroxylating ferredoxin subunit